MDAAIQRRWPVLIGGIAINFCLGAFYAWSVFAAGLIEKFQWSTSEVTMTFFISSLIAPVANVLGGRGMDKYGPRIMVIMAAVFYGGGNFVCGITESLTGLYIAYGIVVAMGMSFAYASTISNTVKFFPERKGLVSGIMTASIGVATIVIAPLAQNVIELYDVKTAFKLLGIFCLLVMLLGSLPLRKAPEHILKINSGEQSANVKDNTDKTSKEMLKMPRFYILTCMLMIGSAVGLMITSQASTMAQEMVGVTASTAAVAVSIFAFANAGGRLVWGMLSDKIGWYNVLPLMFAFIVAGELFMIMVNSGEWTMFITGICMIAFSYGGFLGIYPAVTAENFGLRHQGSNYGFMFLGFSLGGAIGTRVPTIFDDIVIFGYSGKFMIALTMGVMGIALSLLIRRVSKKIR